MLLISVLWVFVLMPLQGAFQDAGMESRTVVEGQTLDLNCVVAGSNNSSPLQWLNPHWFVIFLNNQRGLKDPRYKLIHYSKDALSIRLTNVTTQDEGQYTCFHYSVPLRTKKVNVTVLAAPSSPLLEELRIGSHNTEETIVLRCSTWGSKPPPQITWLLGNGMELFGDVRQFVDHRKKCNTTSTLTVHTYTQKSTVICVIRHKALGGGNLTAAFHLEPIARPGTILNEGNSHAQTPSATSEATILISYTSAAESDQVLNVTERTSSTQTPSSEAATLNPNTTDRSSRILNVTGGNTSSKPLSSASEVATLSSNTTDGSSRILNSTGGSSSSKQPISTSEAATLSSNITNGTNRTYEGFTKRSSSVLLPILVAALLSALFLIVLLFAVKLWKAHVVWKRENDIPELTLENVKPRPHEDNRVPEKNGHAVGWQTNKQYVTEEACT